MNKEAFFINEDGSWDMSKSKWITVPDNDNGEELTISVDKPYTLIPPPQPCYDPRFDFVTDEWTEHGQPPIEQEPELDEQEKQIQFILKEIEALKVKDKLLEQEIDLLKNKEEV